MRKRYRGFISAGLLSFVLLSIPCLAGSAAKDSARKDNTNSIVITFKDGHQQTFSLAEVARIEFTSPAPAASKSPGSEVEPGRHRFIGQWTVGDAHGHVYLFTFEENGRATNNVDNGHGGTWTYLDGELRVSWDNGWHDAIRKVGTKYKKFAFAPGASFNDTPDHVGEAHKTNPEPI